jgi:hypothetical protein
VTAKIGTKVASILLGLAFSLVVVVGCNTEEPAPDAGVSPAAKPAPGAAAPQVPGKTGGEAGKMPPATGTPKEEPKK